MNENDFEQFRNIWTLMSDLYGKSQPSPNTLEIIFRSLTQFKMEDISAAASYYIRTGKFMPRPADLAEIIRGTTEDRARASLLVAIAAAERIRLWKNVHFDDDNTMVVINALGGWAEFCYLLKTQRPQTESRFIKWYQASLGMRNKDVPYMLRGADNLCTTIEEVKNDVNVCNLPILSINSGQQANS